MTTTICNVCNCGLEPNYRNQDTLKGEAALITKNENRVGGIEVRSFDFEVTVTCFKFTMTNFHVCNRCIVEAVGRSFKKEVA